MHTFQIVGLLYIKQTQQLLHLFSNQTILFASILIMSWNLFGVDISHVELMHL